MRKSRTANPEYSTAMREWQGIIATYTCTCGAFEREQIVNYKKHTFACAYRQMKQEAERKVAIGFRLLDRETA